MRIGIRREDKSPFETRVPVVPGDLAELVNKQGIPVSIQSSDTRVFSDETFRRAGAQVTPDLSDCDVILGIKEIPAHVFRPGKVYLFFSHTIKGQSYNMPMLQRMMELGCTLIDYERIVDREGRRLVFFGNFAGLAGMIDVLWTLGRRLHYDGVETPFCAVRQALHYDDLAQAENEITRVGQVIQAEGLPRAVDPLVCGFAGYGNVSQGAQQIYDLLGVREISPRDLLSLPSSARGCYKVVFYEKHLVERADPSQPFELQEYYDHPELYAPTFRQYLDHLTVLVNCIYWEARYPRLVCCTDMAELFGEDRRPRLRVIGDITCDIEGSIECTVRATDPGDPVYVYEPATGRPPSGVEGDGPVILANNILPCELPVDASRYFSNLLRDFIPAVANADFSGSLPDSGLPPELQRATVLYRGQLTPDYRYLTRHVQ